MPVSLESNGRYLPGTDLRPARPPDRDTSLDPPETTPESLPASHSMSRALPLTELRRVFRHSGWHAARKALHEAMLHANLPMRRVARFASCGASAWILQSTEDPGLLRVIPDFCHDRWCIPCARTRSARIVSNLMEHVDGQLLRLLTLTLRADPSALRSRVDRLLKAFGRLRSRRFWRDRVSAGVGFLEITRGRSGDHWHAHLHVIVKSAYIDQRALSDAWVQVTGDSPIVDIRKVWNPGHVAKYVSKYVTKPLDAATLKSPQLIREAIEALRGRKLIYAFGAWARLKLLKLPTDTGWTMYASLDELEFRAAHGDDYALAILCYVLVHEQACDGEPFSLGPVDCLPP